MKRYLFSLICAAVVGTAWAQSPAVIPATKSDPQVIPASSSAPAAALVGVTAHSATADCGKTDACCPAKDCCPKTKTVCVSTPAKEVKTTVLYSIDHETVCHKPIFQFLKKPADCNSCAEGACGHPYTKCYLYKRVCKEEVDTFKCVPVQQPVCEKAKCETKCCTPTCASGSCCGSTVVPSQPMPTMPPAKASNAPATPEAVNTASPPIATPLSINGAPVIAAPLP
jgi:hypothetical protein